MQQAFGKAVLRQALHRVGQVLLDGVDKRVDDAVGDLLGRQGEGLGWVQHREHRKHVAAHERQLGVCRLARHHRAIVHFRTRGRQGQHRAKRQGARHVAAVLQQDVPCVAVKASRCRDKLGAVNHRAAANSQQKVDLFALDLLDCFHQRFIGRVRLNAAKLLHRAFAQCCAYFGQRAGFLGTGATVQNQHFGAGGHQIGQLGDLVTSENDLGGVVKRKTLHAYLLK